MRFKIDWVSLIVGRKFAVFALFYFVLEGIFQVQAPGGLYLERRFNGGLGGGGLIHGGAYFRNFTVFCLSTMVLGNNRIREINLYIEVRRFQQ